MCTGSTEKRSMQWCYRMWYCTFDMIKMDKVHNKGKERNVCSKAYRGTLKTGSLDGTRRTRRWPSYRQNTYVPTHGTVPFIWNVICHCSVKTEICDNRTNFSAFWAKCSVKTVTAGSAGCCLSEDCHVLLKRIFSIMEQTFLHFEQNILWKQSRQAAQAAA